MGLGMDDPDKINILTLDSDSATYAEEIKAVLMA